LHTRNIDEMVMAVFSRLESYPQFLFLLLLGGLEWPVVSAGAGVVFLASRVAYAQGYYTGGM
jgi:glutathione S-transferase